MSDISLLGAVRLADCIHKAKGMDILWFRAISGMTLTLFIASMSYADPTNAPGEAAEGIFGEGSGQGVTSSRTGAMIYNYSFDLPSARGRPQPRLALNYNSSTRDREAGYGWGVDLPVIERKPLSGNPCFTDDGTPIVCGELRRDETGNFLSEERYTFNGQPLVFICRMPGLQRPNDLDCGDEPPPNWSHIPDWGSGVGWRYFRLQVEGQFARFYLSKDRKYWRVQLKGGEVLEFGHPNGYAVEHPRNNPKAILRWRLFRHIDELHSAGNFPNYIEYRWSKYGKRGLLYLTDIFDTPRPDAPSDNPDFAHRTRLIWEVPPYPQTHYADTYRATPEFRISHVVVTSKTWWGLGPREVLRTYRLGYAEPQGKLSNEPYKSSFQIWNHSFLKQISVEGQCDKYEYENGVVPVHYCQTPSDKARGTRSGLIMPATTFEYKEANPSFNSAFLTAFQVPPPKPYDYNNVLPYIQSAGVVDFNKDGLPDLVQSWDSQYCPGEADDEDAFHETIRLSITHDYILCKYKREEGPFDDDTINEKAFHSSRPITGWLNGGGPPDTATMLKYQCMDAGTVDDPTGLAHFNRGRKPGFFTSAGGATLVGRFGEGVVAWSNAQFAPYQAQRLTVIGKTTSNIGDWSGGTGCDPGNFTESDFNPRWKWKKTQTGFDWAKASVHDPDFSDINSTFGLRPPRWFVDIDGDGLVDRLSRTGQMHGDFEEASVEFTRRYANGDPLPGGGEGPAQVPFVLDPSMRKSLAPSADPRNFCDIDYDAIVASGVGETIYKCEGPTSFYYVDINGDGLVDLVSHNDHDEGNPRVRPGDGTGHFECSISKQPWLCSKNEDDFTAAYQIEYPVGSLSPKKELDVYFHDVTGDGLADLIQYDIASGNVFLWVNQDGKIFACVTERCEAGTVKYPPTGDPNIGEHRVTFADMGGDGIDDIVILSNKGAYVGSFMAGGAPWWFEVRGDAPRPGLLIRIHNGYGATTDIQYQTIQQLDVIAQKTESPWKYHSPVVESVLTRIFTSDASNASVGSQDYIYLPDPYRFIHDTQYFYRDPAYDRWSQSFVGFRKIAVRKGDEKAVTTTTYWFGPCQNNELRQRPEGPEASEAPLCPKGSDDDEYKSRIGSVVRIDRGSLDLWFPGLIPDHRAKALGVPHINETKLLWTKIFDYSTHQLFKQSDRNRRVTFSYPTQTHTYLYDDAQLTITDGIKSPGDGGDALENPRRQLGVRKHLRDIVEYDERGTLKKVIAEGSIFDEDSKPGDQADPATITLFSPHKPLDPDGPSNAYDSPDIIPCNANWQCLTKFVSVWNPKTPYTPLTKKRYTFNWAGEAISVEGWLEKAYFLDRTHAKPGAPFAKNAPGQSLTKGWRTLMQYDYDSVGNVIRRSEGQWPSEILNCETYDYDFLYLHLPRKMSRFKTRCSGEVLITQSTYHRGFEKINNITLPNNHYSEIRLDPFGRPIQFYLPKPDAPLFEGPILAATVTYFDSSPLSYVDIRSMVGTGIGNRSVKVLNGLYQPVLDFNLEAGDKWRLSGWGDRNWAGQVINARRPWLFSGDPIQAVLQRTVIQPPSDNLSFDVHYDYFGRIESIWKSNTQLELLRNTYFPLAGESRDAEQLKIGGVHGKSFNRSETDGFGRAKKNITHIENSKVEDIVTTIDYFPSGQPKTISRTHAGGHYQRTMDYDTLGRLVHNVEPNTGNNWRYAWDDAGQLVGTSDARGCGINLYYDGLGRIKGKDYSPCLESHAAYSAPNLATGAGLEVAYQYDVYEAGQINPEAGFDDHPHFALGNLVAVRDRGTYTRFNYDARDRVRRISRQIARPVGLNSGTSYASKWYTSRMDYELDDQLTRRTTGIDMTDLYMNGTSEEHYFYLPNRRLQGITSSYGTIVKEISYDVEGALTWIKYGDSLGTKATFAYDEWRRLSQYKLSNPLSPFSGSLFDKWVSLGHFDYLYSYDNVGNPLSIMDKTHRFSFQGLPSNAKPVLRRNMKYDDLYRLTSIDYSYRDSSNKDWEGAGNLWQSPFEAENNANNRRPIPQRELPTRIGQQTFLYDGMGNITASEDDLKARYDRSLGAGLGYGTALDGPNQLRSGEGLNVRYEAAGNLSEMKIERPGKCLSGQDNQCAQWFLYDWDEVGQLARARRWDFDGNKLPLTASPAGPAFRKPSWDISYSYSVGSRVRKSATSAGGLTSHSLEIFDTFRIDNASFNSNNGTYQIKPENIHIYVGGIGHVFWDFSNTLPHQAPNSRIGMHLIIGDHLGSNSIAINHATSRVVEFTTYQPYGAIENDYRPLAWKGFREPYKFTGKEEDIEVGVTYFGARYYQPNLGRFMSADPLTIHGLGSNLNPYAYVAGRVMTHVDPLGLDGTPPPDPNNDLKCIGKECEAEYFKQKAAEAAKAAAPPSPVPHDPPTSPATPNPASSEKAPFDPTKDMSRFERWIASDTGGFHDWITTDRNLAAVQTGLTVATIAVATVATGGVALELAAGWTAEGIGAAAMVNMGRAAMAFTEMSLAEQGIVIGGGGVGAALADDLAVFEGNQSLTHFTTEEGLNAILKSGKLNPSLKALNPSDARYGNGQYLTELIPGTRRPGQLSWAFIRNRFQGRRFSHYIEIDMSGLKFIHGRNSVYLIPGESPLNIADRIRSFGQAY